MKEKVSNTNGHRVAIAGLGAIGRVVALAMAAGELPGFELVAVSAGDQARASQWLQDNDIDVPVKPLDALEPLADWVIESAPAALLGEAIGPFVEAGKHVVVLSAGALLLQAHWLERAKETGAVILVPTGALVGLDGVQAAAEGEIESVTLTTRKPPASYEGAPWVVEQNIALDEMTQATCIFEGNALEAAQAFPANVNVVAALALAGAGPQRTRIAVWADPEISRNSHTIDLVSDAARMQMTMESVPSANPKTARIVANSVLALLKKQTATLRMGT